MPHPCPFFYNNECKHDALCVCRDDNEWRQQSFENKLTPNYTMDAIETLLIQQKDLLNKELTEIELKQADLKQQSERRNKMLKTVNKQLSALNGNTKKKE